MVLLKPVTDVLFSVRVESYVGNWLRYNRIKGFIIMEPASKPPL
jgi:hypothetical protein